MGKLNKMAYFGSCLPLIEIFDRFISLVAITVTI
jgi:hypothetical protein